MKASNRVLLKVCIMLFFLSLFMGCAILPKNQMAHSTAEFNVVVEKAQNQMLLLNVLRASKRYPMYFTSFNALRGNMSYNFATGGLNIPFGKIGTGYNGAYSIAPNMSFATNPAFDLVVLDSQEFIRGIMTPVTAGTFEYYWNQGWPRELLMYLFVQHIEDNGEIFKNYPPDEKEFTKFKDKIEKLDLHSLFCKIKKIPKNGNPIKIKDANDIKLISEAKKNGLDLSFGKIGDANEVTINESSYQIACGDGQKTDKKGKNNISPVKVKKNKIEQDKNKQNKAEQNNNVITYEKRSSDGTVETVSENGVKLYLRSPEAIIYYLGEIVRVETEDLENAPKINLCKKEKSEDKGVTIFRVIRKSAMTDCCDNDPVDVEFEGSTYAIEKDQSYNVPCRADQTMHTLSLVSQLIGLQKKGEHAPVTGVVNVVGGK